MDKGLKYDISISHSLNNEAMATDNNDLPSQFNDQSFAGLTKTSVNKKTFQNIYHEDIKQNIMDYLDTVQPGTLGHLSITVHKNFKDRFNKAVDIPT